MEDRNTKRRAQYRERLESGVDREEALAEARKRPAQDAIDMIAGRSPIKRAIAERAIYDAVQQGEL